MAVTMKHTVPRDVTPCSLVEVTHVSEKMYSHHPQNQRVILLACLFFDPENGGCTLL